MMDLLMGMLRDCPKCYRKFYHNIALISDDGHLTEDQLSALLIYFNELHNRKH